MCRLVKSYLVNGGLSFRMLGMRSAKSGGALAERAILLYETHSAPQRASSGRRVRDGTRESGESTKREKAVSRNIEEEGRKEKEKKKRIYSS